MTLSQDGINYICLNFGDAINHCCVSSGLSWYYTLGGTDYPETGATAQIVSRLASGLIDSLTMTSPATGTFTQAELNAANGSPVTLTDAQQIAAHDEPTEDQWCYLAPECSPDGSTKCEGFDLYTCVNGKWALTETNSEQCGYVPPECEPDGTTKCVGYDLYTCQNGVWVLTEVHSPSCEYVPPECTEYTTQAECTSAGCYWWSDGTCHSTQEPPPPPPPIPDWWWIPIVAGVTIIGLYVATKKKK